jgi:Mrp family chromosome partitioning ATPase
MQALVETLKGMADIVIFDTPPALVVTDAVVLSARVDSMVVVVEQGHVSSRALLDLRRMVEQARGRLAGAVINKVKAGVGDYYYHYYYRYYYYSGGDKRVSDGKRRVRVGSSTSQEAAPPAKRPDGGEA